MVLPIAGTGRTHPFGRRIAKTVEGTPDVTTDTYYNTAWQVLEVHEGGDADHPLKQFVWDLRYVDSLVVRFRDAGTDGTIDDTLYYTTDANMNVTALVATDGTVVERTMYDPYGQVTVLSADGASSGRFEHLRPPADVAVFVGLVFLDYLSRVVVPLDGF